MCHANRALVRVLGLGPSNIRRLGTRCKAGAVYHHPLCVVVSGSRAASRATGSMPYQIDGKTAVLAITAVFGSRRRCDD